MEMTSNSKTIMKKINKIRGLTLPDFKAYSKATVIKIMCFCKSMYKQISGSEKSLEINPHICHRLCKEKEKKVSKQFMRKRKSFQLTMLEK